MGCAASTSSTSSSTESHSQSQVIPVATAEVTTSLDQTLQTKPPLKPTVSIEPNISVASPSEISTTISSSTNKSNCIMPSSAPALDAKSIVMKANLLHSVPLLSKLTASEIEQLAGLVSDQHYPPHTPIIQEGEIGHGFFIIAKGECTVNKKGKRAEIIHIATLKAGDYFGEAALINHSKRGATVSSVTPVDVFYLERDHFTSLFAPDRLNVQFAKRQAVSAEKMQVSVVNASTLASSMTSFTPFAGEKTPEVKALILAAISNNILFLNLEPELLDHIVSRMYKKEIKKGTNAIVQGEAGDHLYVVESGLFHIFVNKVKVATREKKSLFGELALMYNSPRAATVTAMHDSVVWVLERSTFRRIVTRSNEKKFNLYLEFLKKCDLLQPLAEYERKKVAEAIDEVSFSANTTVFHQGDEGDAMYIVYSGEVKIVKKEENGASTEVALYKKGDSFGERALLTNDARAATAITTTSVHLLRLDRISFHLLLGPLEEILKKRIQGYESGSTSARNASAPVVPVQPVRVSIEREKLKVPIEFKNLEVVGTLGQGSFGFVQLVRDSISKKYFALKAVNKQQIVKTGQQGHVMSEKNAMLLFQHPFCIQLFATYKDANRLYFLLEPSLGGELFSVLRERTLFDEDTARFYAASVVLAFEYIHSMNYCYRDLKPENLLLGADGYLKVTDFGFAKEVSSGRTWTLCGTPDYLAPEIIAGKGHGKAVDWWTVGVFIYEMLASYPPFYDDDPMKTYARIMRGQVNYPSHFSKNAISIITGFLQAKPTKRLGCLKGAVSEIKTHPWFEGFDWDALIARKIKAPIIPKITSEKDLSNFDDYSKANPPPIMPYIDDGSNWDADF